MLAPFASLASNKRPLVLATVLITAMLAGEILAQSVPMRSCLDLFLLRRGRYKAYSSLDTNKQLFCEHRGMQKPGDMVQNAQGLIIATHEDINEFHRSEINALIDYFDPPCHRFFKNTMSVFEGDKRTGTSSDYPYCQLMTFLDPLKFLEEIQLVVGDNNWAEEQDKHLFKPLERVDRCLDAIIPAIERLGGYHEVLIYNLNFGSKIEKDSNNHHLFAYLKKGPQVLTKEREFRKLWKKLDGFKDALNAYVLTKSEIESTEERYGESCQVLVNTLKPVFEGPSCVGEEGGASLAKAIEVDEELLEMYSGDVSSIRDIYHFIKHWRAYFGCQLYLLHKQYKTPGQRLMQHLVNCVKPKDSVEKQEKPSEEDLI